MRRRFGPFVVWSTMAVARFCLGLTELAAAETTPAPKRESPLESAVRKLDLRVITDEKAADEARRSVRRDASEQLKAANRATSAEWYKTKSREAWEKLRDEKLERLGDSLTRSPFPTEPRNIATHRTIVGDDYAIENITFESRPGIVVTANLYRPLKPPATKMPGIVIVHSHHAPKTQSELQVMGMTFARHGATVLVMDQLGHGERRTHVFAVEGRYAGPYKPSRQDYYFRYNTAVQLSLTGESLMGYMAGDLMCGATLLAGSPGVDPKKLILLGAVAGGGDPAGVTAALDRRFAAVVPFNFGGYEPEDQFPLPADAEKTFDYSGSGSWESTRNLRLSARDGFAPWLVVGSAAPRALVYAHEFRWDEPRDPVWKRLQTIYGFYGAADRLASLKGSGTVRGKGSDDTHCTNIGAVHRAQLYPLLERWFGLPAPKAEYQEVRPAAELLCFPRPIPYPLHAHVRDLAQERMTIARRERSGASAESARARLREQLEPLLGPIAPGEFHATTADRKTIDGIEVERVRLDLKEPGGTIPLPLVILRAARGDEAKSKATKSTPAPIVVAVSQGGKQEFATRRPEWIAAWLERGAVVVLPDLRETGETMSDPGRGRSSGATSLASTQQMLGRTMLGLRLRDLRTVLKYVGERDEFKKSRIALAGDGMVPTNPAELGSAAPLDAEKLPAGPEPLGATVCLLAALYEDSIAAVYAGGGLATYTAVFDEPYFYVPYDCIVPGILTCADISELIAVQNAPVYAADFRDGSNRPTSSRSLRNLDSALAEFHVTDRHKVAAVPPDSKALADWLVGPKSK